MEINEIGTIAERLAKLIDHFAKGNKAAFGRHADIQSGVLAGMLGGRMSKPGFEILQKILTAYPTIEPLWLLFGRGPMLTGEQPSSPSENDYVTIARFQEIESRVNKAQAYLEALEEAEELLKVYRISTNHPSNRKLSTRLGISDEEARELVLSGQIHSKYIGPDNDRARRNGASYLIPESAVRRFLDGTPNNT